MASSQPELRGTQVDDPLQHRLQPPTRPHDAAPRPGPATRRSPARSCQLARPRPATPTTWTARKITKVPAARVDVSGVRGRRGSQEPVLGAADAVVDPTVRRASGRVADNEHALVADPDPTLIEISREISRLGRRPLRRGSRPNRPPVVAGSDAEADGDQVRIGGVAVDPVSA